MRIVSRNNIQVSRLNFGGGMFDIEVGVGGASIRGGRGVYPGPLDLYSNSLKCLPLFRIIFHRRSRFKLLKTVKLVFPILSLDRKLELGTVSLALIFIVSLAPICFA
jgi:hypothetical protein